MKFPFEELYYLKARGPDDKTPAEAWGGYGEPLSENSDVYSHDELTKFPRESWLLNGIRDKEHMSRKLLVFDLDIHKAPDTFDPDRVGIPTDTPVVKSQNGGFHVYFAVTTPTTGKEADFQAVDELPFGIDVRGEYVKQHVVAPNDVPGVSSGYDIVNDESISHVYDPGEAAERITLDGEAALSHSPGCSGAGGYERDEIDPPDELPKCYAAGLSLRQEAPDDENLNTHKVNVYTGMLGLAAGYTVDDVVTHFVEDYYPGDPDDADRERTRYHVEDIAERLDNRYSPPAVKTLQEYGILPKDEACTCGLPGHTEAKANMSEYYNAGLETIANVEGLGDPFEDNHALLKACLHAREETPEVADEKPPYGALIAVAEHVGLDMDDPDEQILGKTTYKVATRVFDDLQPGDV
jgi:hypothetical protein